MNEMVIDAMGDLQRIYKDGKREKKFIQKSVCLSRGFSFKTCFLILILEEAIIPMLIRRNKKSFKKKS